MGVTATQIASGLSQPYGLIASGANLYWVEGANNAGGAIKTVPIAGGTPTVVYASQYLMGDLATDGTKLYFTAQNADVTKLWEVDSVALDGTGEQTVTGMIELGTARASNSTASELLLQGQNLYFLGHSQATLPTVMTVPTSGGTASAVVTGLDPSGGYVFDLLGVDGTGVYYSYFVPGGTNTDFPFGFTPLAGGSPSTLDTPPGTLPNYNGVFAVAAGTAYFILASNQLWKAPSPSGPGAMVTTYTGQTIRSFIGDAAGLYALVSAGSPGVYSVDPGTGKTTFLNAAGNRIGDNLALDSKNLYFSEVSNSTFSLWSLAR